MVTEGGAPEVHNANRRLKRLARASAWVLLAGVVILVFSGWGITETGVIHEITFGLIDRRLADSIHRAMNVPLAFFFLLHVLINIKMTVSNRRPFKGRLIDGALIVVGGCILGVVVYMEYFRLGG